MRQRTAAVAGRLCLVIGLLDIVSAIVSPARETRIASITPYVPGLVEDVARAGALAVGILLVMLARGLSRRKRRAWLAAVALLALSAVLHVVRHHALVPTAVAVLLCAALIAFRGSSTPSGTRGAGCGR
ncbi:hypothetical protein NKH77_40350 [Streptomyces sp. M19]